MESILNIQKSLGLPVSLERANDGDADGASSANPHSWLDLTRGVLQPVAAKHLLGEEQWNLHNQLSDTDFVLGGAEEHSVVFNYAVEMSGVPLQRGSTVAKKCKYQTAIKSVTCRVGYTRPSLNSYHEMSLGQCEAELSMYTQGVNAPTSIGLSREVLHHVGNYRGAQLEALFVRMWLVHLSVLEGGALTVQVDRAALRARVAGMSVDHECDFAKTVVGLRFNGRKLDNTAVAVLVSACSDFTSNADLHARVQRYSFPSVPLTVYGTTQMGTNVVQVQDARATARVITHIASRFSAQAACGAALRTALVMFGVANPGEHLHLKCLPPSVHDDAHSTTAGQGAPYERVTELSERRLLSLSLFVGRAHTQLYSHLLRAAAVSIEATDVDAVRDVILPNQLLLLQLVAEEHDALTVGASTLLDSREYVMSNYMWLWEEAGLMHCIAAGYLVEGSVADEASRAILVPHVQSLSPTDDPAHVGALKHDWAVFTLINALVDNGGEALRGAASARLEMSPNGFRVSQATRNLCGANVRFVLLGMGSHVQITRGESGYSFPPVPGTDPTIAPMKVTDVTPMTDTVRAAPHTTLETSIDELLSQYVPGGSVISRRSVAPTTAIQMPDPGAFYIPPERLTAELQHAVDNHWVVQPTSGEGLLCGARALSAAINNVDASRGITPENVTNALEQVLGEDQLELMRIGKVDALTYDFTADQLAAAADALGGYAIRVVGRDNDGRSYSMHVGREGHGVRELILHHDPTGGGHWSSVGPGRGPVLKVASGRSNVKR